MTPELLGLLLKEMNYTDSKRNCGSCRFLQKETGSTPFCTYNRIGPIEISEEGTCEMWEMRT